MVTMGRLSSLVHSSAIYVVAASSSPLYRSELVGESHCRIVVLGLATTNVTRCHLCHLHHLAHLAHIAHIATMIESTAGASCVHTALYAHLCVQARHGPAKARERPSNGIHTVDSALHLRTTAAHDDRRSQLNYLFHFRFSPSSHIYSSCTHASHTHSAYTHSTHFYSSHTHCSHICCSGQHLSTTCPPLARSWLVASTAGLPCRC